MGSDIRACTRCGRRRAWRNGAPDWCFDCIWTERHVDCREIDPYTGGWRVRGAVLVPVEVGS